MVKEFKSDQSHVRFAALKIDRMAHLIVPVSDKSVAGKFYQEVLGFKSLGSDLVADCGSHQVLRTASGQCVILAEVANRVDLRETGVHQAYRVTQEQRERIASRLESQGAPVLRYNEDRPDEANDNYYLHDPDGNRIQLVVAAKSGIDHACVQVSDILWAEEFFGYELGFPIEHLVGWRTADYVRARRWAAGEEDMAPGTRRLDKRYTVMVNKKTVARCAMQMFFRTGDNVLGIYLAHKHFQDPPETQKVGVPRIGFLAARSELDTAAERLSAKRRPFIGPVDQPSSPLYEAVVYFKDNSGNFLELCAPRHGAAS
jgi:catechol-2,3-dioxygenase